MNNKINNQTQEEEKNEFPQGKDKYCPRCYFEDDKTILRSECPHNKKENLTNNK